jgi:hypothetical protein
MALGLTYAVPKDKVVRPHKNGPAIIDASDILVLGAAMCLIPGAVSHNKKRLSLLFEDSPREGPVRFHPQHNFHT